MNTKEISKKLVHSRLFALCPEAKKCKRACASKHLNKVFSSRAKILCLYTFTEKAPIFYKIDQERSES
ncbi:MAG: hypothetical protein ACE5K3_11370 [bacterium]